MMLRQSPYVTHVTGARRGQSIYSISVGLFAQQVQPYDRWELNPRKLEPPSRAVGIGDQGRGPGRRTWLDACHPARPGATQAPVIRRRPIGVI
jgi:hypothetical protein